ncbi:DUF5590 domain-containing protein [Sporosarcina ureilytica]|uniref:Cell wall elongation regulator TseB-like domain-containing protein n=1 Tax=Sporosarcina ureilytica TaxID=298596 RepID=A0A1D8JH54_9BACL|nr:DUF5590 domain-containing protein [Sporosarcina ureilytica]AOV08045.1 hypothetical protein BI350_11195 [Sporosarcina ureilytica]
MLNWVKFISAFLFALVTVIVITVFYNANKPIATVKDTAAEAAIRSGQIMTVDAVQPYNGTDALVTVFGVNPDGEKVAVFVNEREERKFQEVKLADGVSKETALQTVLQEHKVAKVLHVLLGTEENEPIWEVAFKNESGKLNYVYILFKDGEWSKRILNL